MEHVCWCLSPQLGKSPLSYCSSQSKIAKNNIAYNSLSSALHKLCYLQMEHSFQEQLGHLKNAGFPVWTLLCISFRLPKYLKVSASWISSHTSPTNRPKKLAVISYVHGLSHQHKITKGFDGNVFTAKGKFRGAWATVDEIRKGQSRRNLCLVNHRNSFLLLVPVVLFITSHYHEKKCILDRPAPALTKGYAAQQEFKGHPFIASVSSLSFMWL